MAVAVIVGAAAVAAALRTYSYLIRVGVLEGAHAVEDAHSGRMAQRRIVLDHIGQAGDPTTAELKLQVGISVVDRLRRRHATTVVQRGG